MYAFLIIVHVLIALGLVISVLLQSGKGTGLAGAFGGGGGAMGAVFGGRGAATFLSKLTTGLAIAFFLSCLGQSLLASRRFSNRQDSVIRREMERQARQQSESPVPLVPAPQPAETGTEGTEAQTAPAETPAETEVPEGS
jgi:preprotein translocase subunit SecG